MNDGVNGASGGRGRRCGKEEEETEEESDSGCGERRVHTALMNNVDTLILIPSSKDLTMTTLLSLYQ